MSTEAPVAPAPVVINMTERERHIQRHANIDLDSLPKACDGTRSQDPLIPGRNRVVQYKDGSKREFPATIVDINEHKLKKYHYAWLTDESQRKYSQYAAYVMVRQDNKYGHCADTNQPIPDHYFTNGVIYHGNLALYACEYTWYMSEQAANFAKRERTERLFKKGEKMTDSAGGDDDPYRKAAGGFVTVTDSEDDAGKPVKQGRK